MAAYEYDARNRLIQTGRMKYRYNWRNERIESIWRGKITRYVVDDLSAFSRVLMELDGDGNVLTRYVYGLGLIGREDAATGTYLSYHSDLRGSTTILTNEHVLVTDRYAYGIYGEVDHFEGNTSQPFQYNGRDGVMHDINGLYYMRARYYHTELKRFLNRDVVRGDITDGQTFNRYAYVNGDPVRYVDPLGLSAVDSCFTEGTGSPVSSKTIMSFEEALEALNKSNLRPGQSVISRRRVMEIIENYDPVKANSSVYSNGTTSFVIEGHHTTVANTMLGRGGSFNMNTPTTQLPSATNVYWTKRWYQIWRKSIKVLD